MFHAKENPCGGVIGAHLLFSLLAGSAVGQTDKPNILLLVGDDTAFGDIGSFGSEVKTPNMNTLAEEGVRFTNFHVSPVCSVTRSMLLTGNNNIEVGLEPSIIQYILQLEEKKDMKHI